MEFSDNEAIYLQIASYVGEQVLRQQWPPDQKIPSVRELAAELQVNPNTVMRTYELLQSQGIVYNRRGLGLFVAPAGATQVRAHRRERFLQQELPAFFNTISLLDIGLAELAQRYEAFKTAQAAPLAPTPHEN
ncbi:MAG: GntR family transcriptional regulator [Janthinobacterium lividum]